MIKKSLDEKYFYQIDEHNVVHLFRGEEDCQQLLTNPLLSAIFKIESFEKENAELKCECRTCIYTDSPCVRSDYPSKDGVCSHYKNVFEENTDLKLKLEALEGQTPWKDIKDKSELIKENTKLKEESKKIFNDWLDACDKYGKVNLKLTKAKVCLEQLVSEITVGELEVDPNILQQAEQFLNSEVEK